MIDFDALWSELRANPTDDGPRLQYACRLDELDQPRGEFIRLQCQLERLPLANPLRLELEAREHELLADHESEWLGDLEPLVDWAVFHRGFPTEISLSCETFVKHADRIIRMAPVDTVHLSGGRELMPRLARCRSLAELSFLDLSNNHLRDRGVRDLAESPYLGNLEGLNLSSVGMGDAGVAALVDCRPLVGLRELYLCDNRITRRGLELLADSPLVRQLEVVSLRCNECESSRSLMPSDPALLPHM